LAKGYYETGLAAGRLRRCYDIAPPRIRRYLNAEAAHVASHIGRGAAVLDLGCGFGRTILEWSERAGETGLVAGIDTSADSLLLARESLAGTPNAHFVRMDAAALGFRNDVFDVTACIQNGISAFRVDPRRLIEECLRVTKPGGVALLSTYAEAFWPHRLEWFRLQAREGLIGEIDERLTGGGVIACRDGFRATTVSAERFFDLAANLGATVKLREVDGSSLFCELIKAV
jgi:ubiquinone/menaquinone biosynthesis C-methylase UbiE